MAHGLPGRRDARLRRVRADAPRHRQGRPGARDGSRGLGADGRSRVRRVRGDARLGRVRGRLLGAPARRCGPPGCRRTGACARLPRIRDVEHRRVARRDRALCTGHGHASDSATFPALLAIPAFAVALWATSHKRTKRLSRPQPDGSRIRRTLADWVAGARKARTLLSSPREHGLGVFGMTLYWAGDIACLWAALQLVGGKQITISALILAYSGGYVLSRRSLPAGGAGVVEIALTLALVGMGVRFAPALVAVLIYRLFNFWLPIVPALTLIPTIRELRTRFQRAEQQTT
ncbi:MAG TPA: lysylphosphatidylglycerol synthase transmembrane domain-containing protein [Gaiellaceae bacterium]|nr:lysylphosphatidylglycerol synthase transmembrane domain-containing protein [Gaiellaceae bacterium]